MRAEDEPPDEDQWRVIQEVIDRCYVEYREEKADRVNKDNAEPTRGLTHGFPGTGKSQIIKWVMRFFDEVLGWRKGVEYHVCAPNAQYGRTDRRDDAAWTGDARD